MFYTNTYISTSLPYTCTYIFKNELYTLTFTQNVKHISKLIYTYKECKSKKIYMHNIGVYQSLFAQTKIGLRKGDNFFIYLFRGMAKGYI